MDEKMDESVTLSLIAKLVLPTDFDTVLRWETLVWH